MNDTPLDDDTQARIDHLTERVAGLEADNIRLWGYLRTPTPPAPALDEAHEPPHGIRTEPDEAAKWKSMKNYAIEIDMDEDMGWEQHCRLIIAKAIALGLAAPADRTVCKVTDELVDSAYDIITSRTFSTTHAAIRAALQEAAAAYWTAPAGVEGEGKVSDRERIVNALTGDAVAIALDQQLAEGSYEYQIAHEGPGVEEIMSILAPGIADVVLAVLGDRLLPKLPEGWKVNRVLPRGLNVEVVLVQGYTGIVGSQWPEMRGTGPTITDAIRNALEDDHVWRCHGDVLKDLLDTYSDEELIGLAWEADDHG